MHELISKRAPWIGAVAIVIAGMWAMGSLPACTPVPSDNANSPGNENEPGLATPCLNAADGDACDDSDPCTGDDVCEGGTCAGTPIDDCIACEVDADCDDDNPCTDEVCAAGVCSASDNSDVCDDGNGCTSGDACDGGQCVGTPISGCTPCTGDEECDDDNTCTDDACDAGVCASDENASACDDGDPCTTGDVCADAVCSGTAVIGCQPCEGSADCVADAVCVSGQCEEGACAFEPLSTGSCDDGDPCTGDDSCDNGLCAGELIAECIPCSANAECNDDNDCTDDTCDDGACANEFNAVGCDDGDECTSGDVCTGGECIGVDVPGCDDCTDATQCNDNNPCTADSCVLLHCVNTPTNQGGTCVDGNACTSNDVCNASGVCAGTVIPGCKTCGVAADCNDNNGCTTDVCTGAGVCSNTVAPLGAPVTLTLSEAGDGDGEVNFTPKGTGPGQNVYDVCTEVTITATPDGCSTFTNYSGDAGGAAPSTKVTMNTNRTVTASFADDLSGQWIVTRTVTGVLQDDGSPGECFFPAIGAMDTAVAQIVDVAGALTITFDFTGVCQGTNTPCLIHTDCGGSINDLCAGGVGLCSADPDNDCFAEDSPGEQWLLFEPTECCVGEPPFCAADAEPNEPYVEVFSGTVAGGVIDTALPSANDTYCACNFFPSGDLDAVMNCSAAQPMTGTIITRNQRLCSQFLKSNCTVEYSFTAVRAP